MARGGIPVASSTTVSSYYVLCPYPFRPLSRESILQSRLQFSPACLLSVRIRENGSDDAMAFVDYFRRNFYARAIQASLAIGNVNQMSRCIFLSRDERDARQMLH